MGLGTSIFLIALGAILDFAVTATAPGFNIHAVGVILMLVGIIGAVLSLFYWNSWGGFRRTRTVYQEGYAAPTTTRVIREEIS